MQGRLRQIGDDVAYRLLLRRCQRVGQGRDDARAQPPLRGGRAPGAGALMRAQERERQLPGQEFVISEPRPWRVLRLDVLGRLRPMHVAQRVGKAFKAVALEPVGVLPFRQGFRYLIERRLDRASNLVGVQTFGERVDRIDQRQLGEAGRVDHAVGINHL